MCQKTNQTWSNGNESFVLSFNATSNLFLYYLKILLSNAKIYIYVYVCVCLCVYEDFNPLKPTGYVMHHQFNIQQLYVLPTL